MQELHFMAMLISAFKEYESIKQTNDNHYLQFIYYLDLV